MDIKALVAILMLAGVSSAATTQDSGDEILEKIINLPPPTAYRIDGAKGAIRDDPQVQGGKALRIKVPGKRDNAWAVAVANPINKSVKSGDEIVLAFWARLENGENGATAATLPYNAVQLAQDPWTPVFTGSVTIGPHWKLHEVKGKSDRDYPAGALNVAIHLATGKQTIDLGPVFVLNMGQ